MYYIIVVRLGVEGQIVGTFATLDELDRAAQRLYEEDYNRDTDTILGVQIINGDDGKPSLEIVDLAVGLS